MAAQSRPQHGRGQVPHATIPPRLFAPPVAAAGGQWGRVMSSGGRTAGSCCRTVMFSAGVSAWLLRRLQGNSGTPCITRSTRHGRGQAFPPAPALAAGVGRWSGAVSDAGRTAGSCCRRGMLSVGRSAGLGMRRPRPVRHAVDNTVHYAQPWPSPFLSPDTTSDVIHEVAELPQKSRR